MGKRRTPQGGIMGKRRPAAERAARRQARLEKREAKGAAEARQLLQGFELEEARKASLGGMQADLQAELNKLYSQMAMDALNVPSNFLDAFKPRATYTETESMAKQLKELARVSGKPVIVPVQATSGKSQTMRDLKRRIDQKQVYFPNPLMIDFRSLL